MLSAVISANRSVENLNRSVRTRTVFVTARIQTRYEYHEFLWWALSSPNSSRYDGNMLIFSYLCWQGCDSASGCYVRGMIAAGATIRYTLTVGYTTLTPHSLYRLVLRIFLFHSTLQKAYDYRLQASTSVSVIRLFRLYCCLTALCVNHPITDSHGRKYAGDIRP